MYSLIAWSPDAIWVIAQKVWWFLVVLGVLIAFHELGHLMAARWVGVRVLKYSLGFGPKVFGRQIGETEYLISAFPLGGYVKLFGEEEADASSPEERRRSFVHQSLPRKMFIVAAGPGFNFILAYLIFFGWLATGAPLFVPAFQDLTPDVEAVVTDSPAAKAGLQVGDRVVRVNDEQISTKTEMLEIIATSKGKPLRLEIKREGELLSFRVVPEPIPESEGQEETYYRIGIEEPAPVVTAVMGDMPAAVAGFQAGDRVVVIEGKEIDSWSGMTEVVKNSPGRPLDFVVLRDGDRVDLTVIPTVREREVNGKTVEEGVIGISGQQSIIRASSPAAAVLYGARATWHWTELTLVVLGKVVTGEMSRKTIGGPITIAQVSGEAAEQGASSVLFLIAILSINLGVLNLLPIPILDGGHLLFFAIEGILRKPLGERQRELAQQAGLLLLICIMVFVFWNDIERLLSN